MPAKYNGEASLFLRKDNKGYNIIISVKAFAGIACSSWATSSRCFIGSIGSIAVAQAEVKEKHHY